jgi:hexosaminidase
MIDTGRHFLSLALIRHAIDGLAALKMNVLHWHLLDSQSFPVASQAYPQLSAAGAFAAAATYSLDDLRGVVAYAKQRGVRVVPEIEMPGHGSFSAGMPELSLASCADVLDPTRNSTYVFLAAFLAEMATVFDDQLIYLGGDEVGVGEGCVFNGTRFKYCGYHCFDTDPTVAAWMAAQTPPLNSSELVQYFWTQLSKRVLPALDRTPGVWMSDDPCPVPVFLRPDMRNLPAGAVANVYEDWQAAPPLLDAGTPVVLSIAYDGWYLDHHPDFATVYNVHPCDSTWLACDAHPQRRALFRGGSASMWGEHVDATNFDVEVWPGTTALAERLWSDPPNITAAAAQARHQSLACHWKMWGVPTITREKAGGEFVSVLDAVLPPCPADWCEVPA